jgi:mRNA interferase RelE/StbE
MKSYRIILVKRAQKELESLPKKDQKRVARVIDGLETDPFIGKQLQGDLAGWRAIRVWPYRIVYVVEKQIVTVTILRIGHRKDVYRA